MQISFHGAAGGVTGSCHLVEAGERRILVDCGMFQERKFLGRNWQESPVPAEEIDAVVLTHAHLDHCGLIPRLVQKGFRGPIISTAAIGTWKITMCRNGVAKERYPTKRGLRCAFWATCP